MALGLTTLTSYAQINVHMQTACNPQDVKTYDTERLRSSFHAGKYVFFISD